MSIFKVSTFNYLVMTGSWLSIVCSCHPGFTCTVSSNSNLTFFRLQEISDDINSTPIQIFRLFMISSQNRSMNVTAKSMLSRESTVSSPPTTALMTRLDRRKLVERAEKSLAFCGSFVTSACDRRQVLSLVATWGWKYLTHRRGNQIRTRLFWTTRVLVKSTTESTRCQTPLCSHCGCQLFKVYLVRSAPVRHLGFYLAISLNSLVVKSVYIRTKLKAIGSAEERTSRAPRGSMFKPRLGRYIVFELFFAFVLGSHANASVAIPT